MAINWRIAPEDIMDKVEIARFTEAMNLLKLETGTAIDSYTMSPNGSILSSIYVINEDYLVEVNLGGKNLEFDFCAAACLINYRISFGEHSTSSEGSTSNEETNLITESAKRIKFVQVTLRHTNALVTKMSFFGENLNSWLEFVLNAYPKSNLLKY